MSCLPPRSEDNSAVNRIKFWLRLTALLTWAFALAFFSLVPNIRTPSGPLSWDKFNHFAAYAVLALLLIRALTARYKVSLRLLGVSWLACAVYGLLLEGLQWLMGVGRQWEPRDLLANALGALVVCVIFRHIGMKSSVINER